MLQTLLALIVLSAPPSATPAVSEESQVQKAFEAYREAVLAKNGAAAAASLDEESVHYYARARDSALNDDEETLRREPFLFRMTVLRLRKDLGADLLLKLNGRELIAVSVDRGWVSPSSVEKIRLGKVEIKGPEATSESFVGEQKAPFSFTFKRDAQGWRFSLLSMMAFVEPTFKELAQRAGKTEDELIFALLAQTPGDAPTPELWNPLVPGPAAKTNSAGVVLSSEGGEEEAARPRSRVLGALGGKAFIFKRSDGKARTFNARTSCPDVKKDDEVVFIEGDPDGECEEAAFENRRTKSVCNVVCRKLTP